MTTQGVRLNNPGNIRAVSANNWTGQVGEENGFCKFSHLVFGLKAVFSLLDTYQRKHGILTVDTFAARWAPSFDNNDPKAYADYVVKFLTPLHPRQWDVNSRIDMLGMVKGICGIENAGWQPPPHVLEAAWQLYLDDLGEVA